MKIESSRQTWDGQTDKRTNEHRFAFLELLLEPKIVCLSDTSLYCQEQFTFFFLAQIFKLWILVSPQSQLDLTIKSPQTLRHKLLNWSTNVGSTQGRSANRSGYWICLLVCEHELVSSQWRKVATVGSLLTLTN